MPQDRDPLFSAFAKPVEEQDPPDFLPEGILSLFFLDDFWGEKIIRFVYLLGVLGLLAYGVIDLFGYFMSPEGFWGELLFLGGLVLSGVGWRVTCEILVLQYRTHENTESIYAELRKNVSIFDE